MPKSIDVAELLNREFLGIRSRLIDLAAALDRIDRGQGSVASDPRIDQIRRSLALLAEPKADRAEQVQLIFSLPYQSDWEAQYGVAPSGRPHKL